MTPRPELIWAHNGRTMFGWDTTHRFDPGVGPGRYARALEMLRDSGAEVAFASFTFDPEERGSVVIVPGRITDALDRSSPERSLPAGRVVSDGSEAWLRGMGDALAAIEEARVAKVVLNRQLTIDLDQPPPTTLIAEHLRRSQSNCYTFLVDGLIGASPELLVSLESGVISSLALAGTAPNEESLETEKMDLEHLLAAASVREGISKHVTDLKPPTRSVLEFGEIKHLATRFEGPAIDDATVLDVLGTLHPTASVAGTPTETSLRLIREIEPNSRGRYAGPIGWFNSAGEGEFALALRCGLIEGTTVKLFAGGGIVNGSMVEAEYEETQLKFRPMLQALNLA